MYYFSHATNSNVIVYTCLLTGERAAEPGAGGALQGAAATVQPDPDAGVQLCVQLGRQRVRRGAHRLRSVQPAPPCGGTAIAFTVDTTALAWYRQMRRLQPCAAANSLPFYVNFVDWAYRTSLLGAVDEHTSHICTVHLLMILPQMLYIQSTLTFIQLHNYTV